MADFLSGTGNRCGPSSVTAARITTIVPLCVITRSTQDCDGVELLFVTFEINSVPVCSHCCPLVYINVIFSARIGFQMHDDDS